MYEKRRHYRDNHPGERTVRRVALERMGTELFYINRHRRGQPLRPQNVEAKWRAIGLSSRRQAVFFARFVARDQWFAILNRCRWSGKDCDPRLA